MQIENNSAPLPTSVLVICILGLIYSGLAAIFALMAIFANPIYIVSLLLHAGFITACILMLNRRYAGRIVYHVCSGIWLFFLIVEFVLFAVGASVMSGFMSGDHFGGAGHLVGGIFAAMIIFSVITAAIVVTFNILLCSKNIADCWRR